MTRAEVQNNIRYNERLVTQYQNQVNDFQRKISSLESQIRALNSQKADYASKENKMKKQIDELTQLRKKYESLQTNFSNRQSKRMKNFNANFSHSLNVNFIKSYVTEMKTLLSGSEYKKAYNGLTTAIEKISTQITSLRKQADDLHQKALKAQQEINTKQWNIQSYRSQKNAATTNLSYRRQRINYWKEQLRYATN